MKRILLVTAVVLSGLAAYPVWGPYWRDYHHPGTPLQQMERRLLKDDRAIPGVPELELRYGMLNARHFNGALPQAKVLWEPRLADVGDLIGDGFSLEGLTDGKTVLLNPSLTTDDAIVRTLCHEMVHVQLIANGATEEGHGDEFQRVLRRLSDEHAFVGIPATAGEREALRAQLAQDGAALDAAQKSLTEARALLVQTEQQINDRAREFNARMDAANTAQAGWPAGTERDAIVAAQHDLTAKTTHYNTQAREFDARITAFNAATKRYNLMLVYPDGKDTENQIAERAGAKPVK